MFENCKYRKASFPLALLVGSLLAAVIPLGSATAEDSSPYLIGHWKLHDHFSDFKPTGTTIVTEDTEFVFLNPTQQTLTLEYAFFDEDGTFCGCDRDTLKPNGLTRYTMLAEQQGGFLSRKLCPTQTDGTLKTIVFQNGGHPTFPPSGELQAGYQINLFKGNGRTESPLLAVPINGVTFVEEQFIHAACVSVLGQ